MVFPMVKAFGERIMMIVIILVFFMTKVVQIELSFSFRHVHTKVRHIVTIIIWCIKML